MTRTRALALAALLTVTVTGTGTALAAKPKPKPPLCNLITDKSGDVASGDQSLDVIGGDIATTPKLITAVVRFAKLSAQDLNAPSGRYIEFSFAYEGRGQSLSVYIPPTGDPTWGKGGTGKIDLAKNEIRMHLPVENLIGRPALKQGAVLTDLLVRADLGNPAYPIPTSMLLAGDSASGTKPYPVHAPSCVRVGA